MSQAIAPPPTPLPARPSQATPHKGRLPGGAVRVLVVEDNPGDAALLVEMLTEGPLLPDRPAADVVAVDRLAAAVAAVREAPFDVVLLDLSLPDARGLHAVHALHGAAPNVPIVVVTGLADDATSLAAVHAGAQDYLVKGQDDGRVVRRALRYAIERARSARERDALFAREREARQAAQRAAHLRDEVLSIVSHDLRTPLGTIAVCAQALLAADEPRPETRESYETIQRSARWANRIIGDLLDVASIEAGRLSIYPEQADPAALAAELEAMFAPLAAERSVRLVADVGPNVPPVHADPERVVQAVGNLVSNALKFTPRGGEVVVRVEGADGGRLVRFAVVDTGRGIDPADVPHLFDRFWQARTSRRGGAGLGLAIARGIAELHGGSIAVASEPGRGSTFTLTLPAM